MRGTANIGLVYDKASTDSSSVVRFVDSDFTGDLDKRKSPTGYVFALFGSVINWKAMLQPTVALSTPEAKYMAAREAVKEAIWLKGLVGDLGLQQDDSIVFCDNQSAIHLTKNPMYHDRSKHIAVKYNFIHETVFEGLVVVKKVATTDNPADMMTKSVPLHKFKHCLDLIGVCSL